MQQVRRLGLNPDQLGIKPGDPKEEYRTFLRDKLDSFGAKLVGYPLVPHEELARRSISRKKPFLEGDRGYRDTLIWFSILDALKTENEDIALVTEDKGFGDSSELHQDLLDDIKAKGISAERVKLLASLRDFAENYINPLLLEEKDLVKKLQKTTAPLLNLYDFLLNDLVGLVKIKELDSRELDLPYYFETITLNSIEDVENIDFETISAKQELQKHKYL